jgi:hypothetical protein
MVKSKKKMEESRHKSQSLQEDNDEVQISSSTKSEIVQVSDTIKSTSSSASDDSLSDDDDNDEEEEDYDLFNNAVSKWAELKEKEEEQSETVEQASSHHNKSTVTKSISSQSSQSIISEKGTEIAYLGNRKSTTTNAKNNSFSLHITNLPYTAQKETICSIFTKHGCRVTSTRLVFNYHNKNRMNTKSDKSNPKTNGFTGVAFVDLADKKSFQKGLELNRLRWSHLVEDSKKQVKGNTNDKKKKKNIDKDIDISYNGRINVRPTRTPEELAQIVNNTKEKLAMKRKQEHNDHSQEEVQEPSPKKQKKNLSTKKPQGSGENDVNKTRGKPAMKLKQDMKDHKNYDRVQRQSPKKQKQNQSTQAATGMKSTTTKTKNSKEKHSKKNDSPDRKLTKKERARKAAILNSKKAQKKL